MTGGDSGPDPDTDAAADTDASADADPLSLSPDEVAGVVDLFGALAPGELR